MNNKKERQDKGPPDRKEEAYDYDYCSKHKLRYPAGTDCPKCKDEER